MEGVEAAYRAWGESMKDHRPAYSMENPRPQDAALINKNRARVVKCENARVIIGRAGLKDLFWVSPNPNRAQIPGIVTDERGEVIHPAEMD